MEKKRKAGKVDKRGGVVKRTVLLPGELDAQIQAIADEYGLCWATAARSLLKAVVMLMVEGGDK